MCVFHIPTHSLALIVRYQFNPTHGHTAPTVTEKSKSQRDVSALEREQFRQFPHIHYCSHDQGSPYSFGYAEIDHCMHA